VCADPVISFARNNIRKPTARPYVFAGACLPIWIHERRFPARGQTRLVPDHGDPRRRPRSPQAGEHAPSRVLDVVRPL